MRRARRNGECGAVIGSRLGVRHAEVALDAFGRGWRVIWRSRKLKTLDEDEDAENELLYRPSASRMVAGVWSGDLGLSRSATGFDEVRILFESDTDYLVIYDEEHSDDEDRGHLLRPLR